MCCPVSVVRGCLMFVVRSLLVVGCFYCCDLLFGDGCLWYVVFCLSFSSSLFIVGCRFFECVLCRLLYLWFAVCLLIVLCGLPFAVCRLLCSSLYVVRCLLFVVCCLSFVVWCVRRRMLCVVCYRYSCLFVC